MALVTTISLRKRKLFLVFELVWYAGAGVSAAGSIAVINGNFVVVEMVSNPYKILLFYSFLARK